MSTRNSAIEFLPAVLEIQDRPPNPLGRMVLWAILLLFVTAVAWSIIGTVDIVAVAPGRVIPSGHAKVIQPASLGIIRALHVREGQVVRKGDLLVELDPAEDEAEVRRLRILHGDAAERVKRLERLHRWLRGEETSPIQEQHVPENESIEENTRLLMSEWESQQSKREAIQQEINADMAERKALQEEISKLEALLPIMEKRLKSYKSMAESGYMARNQWLELKQQHITMLHDLAANRERKKRLDAMIRQARARLDTQKEDFEREVLQKLAEARTQMKALREEMEKAVARNGKQQLHAPVDGVVQELKVHTIGGVVTPGQVLMKIVPEDASVEIEAWVENKDIGFVHEGQRVAVKVDAYPYTKYGMLEGKLVNLSADAIQDEKKGLVYAARVRLDNDTLIVDGNVKTITPGMTVVSEIKTGKRKLIDYLIDPLKISVHESFHEK